MGTSAAVQPSRPSTGFFPVFAALALVVSIGLTSVVGAVDPWQLTTGSLLSAAALAAAFAVFRKVAIEVDLRQDAVRLTLTEVPLVVGVFWQSGLAVTVAYAAVVSVVSLLRRDALAKFALNLAICVNAAATASLVAHATRAAPTEWAAVLLGVAAGLAVGTLTLLGGLLLLPGSRRPATTARLCLDHYLVGMLTAAATVGAVQVVTHVPAGAALVTVLGMVLAVIYRGYYDLLHDQRDLELVNQVSLEVAGAGRSAEGTASGALVTADAPKDLSAALELSRDQLNAARVVLHRRRADGGTTTVVAGEPLPREDVGDDVDVLLLPVGADEQHRAVRVRAATADPDQQRALAARGASEVLAVRLRGADGDLGVLEVHDRQSRLRGFDAADQRLVETLASHLTTALDNRRLLARLQHDAHHDPLTGLRNRLGFRETARRRIADDAALRATVLVLIDLELLASVNDALGHVWGDAVVVTAGRRLRDTLPADVLVARLEGDTFAVLLVDVDEPAAMRTAEALRVALTKPYDVRDLALECNPVLGVALTTIESTRDVDTLLQRADVALQAARTGDAPVRHYVPSMGQGFARRFQLLTQFRGALDSGEVDVHFQPQVALATRQVIGVEVLVRWQHPELGILDPEEFVAVIETTGLIDALTSFVLDRALAQCREWSDRGLGLAVAVNLSVRNLADTGFPARVDEALTRHGVPASRLVFELTESAVMSDPERALPVLRDLHNLGLRIAVDDFGTGYSSLAYLRRLPVDEVKIDKSFVLGMGSDLSDDAIVRAIVDLGHSLSLTVVAEGVEQDTVRDQLIEMGCDVAQGYLISRPLGRERFDAWLRARTVVARGAREQPVVMLVR